MKKFPLIFFILMVMLALGLSMTFHATSSAQSSDSVLVPRRDADVTIQTNGNVRVVETWQVQFRGGTTFHKAFRTIDMSRIEKLSDISVGENGESYQPNDTQAAGTFYVTQSDNDVTINWFFSPTQNQTRTFTLGYTLQGVVRQYPAGDQLWWTFIEGDRPYSINAAHVVEHLPAAFAADQIVMGASMFGSGAKKVDAQTVSYDGGPFPPGTAWELRTQFPHGVVTAPPPRWQPSADIQVAEEARQQVINFGQLWGGIIVLVGGVLGAIGWNYARNRGKPVALQAEYLEAPPDQLLPGLAGTLVAREPDTRDVVATLVDLARRGLLKMDATGADYIFTRTTGVSEAGLRPYEKDLLERFFNGESSVHLSDWSEKFAGQEDIIEAELETELVQQGYFVSSSTNNKYSPFFWVLTALFWVALIGGVVMFFANLLTWYTAFDIIVILIVTTVLSRLLTNKPKTTDQGTEAAAKWNAFKRYLENIQKYTQVGEAKQLFEKYLPYAIAFGVEKSWLNAFQAVDTPAPAWYTWNQAHDTQIESTASHTTSTHMGAHGGGTPAPSLNDMASGAFRGLNGMSESFMSMLNTTAETITSTPPSTGSSSGSDFSSSSSGSSFSGGGSSGGSSGGGSSGFG